ncbi:hypothetical protein PVAP13_9KG102420 [Panicum virgatum]|uniref:Uncharacterized protein n=1 Tax=Panicum virgatum TaxID=38727 RepID=A0A8T0NKR9_PANVG|nr:hypothetical protein PVAP13_9KG102420 [Panicum virgatum]
MQCIYYRSIMQSMYSYHLTATDNRQLFSSVFEGKKNNATIFNLLLIVFGPSKGSK